MECETLQNDFYCLQLHCTFGIFVGGLFVVKARVKVVRLGNLL